VRFKRAETAAPDEPAADGVGHLVIAERLARDLRSCSASPILPRSRPGDRPALAAWRPSRMSPRGQRAAPSAPSGQSGSDWAAFRFDLSQGGVGTLVFTASALFQLR
jgi:hypothetical protein